MFIEKLTLKNLYMFHDNVIDLCYPKGNGNTINIIIGANGTGKTKLLKFIWDVAKCAVQNSTIGALSIGVGSIINFTNNQDLTFSIEIKKNQLSYKFLPLNNSSEVQEKLQKTKIYFIPSQLLYKLTNTHNNINLKQIIDAKVIEINQSFTDYASKLINKAILAEERNSNEVAELRKSQSIDWFNKYFIDTNINSKLLEIEDITEDLIFTDLSAKNKFKFNDLSSGEQQLYIKIASLILMKPHDSLVLIDEPELSLHPEWQAAFISTLKKIGSNNQFIIATHSPYIVSNLTPEDNLIVLNFDKKKHIVISYNPEFIERDINTTIDIMGYSHQLPPRVLELREKYREYFDKKEEESEEGLKIKNELLQYETLDSSFFQEIEFLRALRK